MSKFNGTVFQSRCNFLPVSVCHPCLSFQLGSGSGGDTVEAIADLLSIARLLPGHDPGAGHGVATVARQLWQLAIRYFALFGGPVAAANDELTDERTNDTCAGTSRRDCTAGARPSGSTSGHGGHGQSLLSLPATAERLGRGISASRNRRARHRSGCVRRSHGCSYSGYCAAGVQAQRARRAGRGTDQIECEMAGERRARLRCGDRCGGGHHQGGRAGQTKRTGEEINCCFPLSKTTRGTREIRPGDLLF